MPMLILIYGVFPPRPFRILGERFVGRNMHVYFTGKHSGFFLVGPSTDCISTPD